MGDPILFDIEKSAPVEAPAPDLAAQDVKDFCDHYMLRFYAMGTVPGSFDPNHLGWDDPTRFRVSRIRLDDQVDLHAGHTIELEQVREWRKQISRFDAYEEIRFKELVSAAAEIGTYEPVMEHVLLERLVREAAAGLQSAWAQECFARSDAVTSLAMERHQVLASGEFVEDTLTTVRLMDGYISDADEVLQNLLRAAMLPLAIKGRQQFFESKAALEVHRISRDIGTLRRQM